MKDAFKNDQTPPNIERIQYVTLTKRLIDIMTDFCLLTLQSVSKKNQASLNTNQIEEIINFDLQFRIQQLNDPELLDLVRDNAKTEFLENQEKYHSHHQ